MTRKLYSVLTGIILFVSTAFTFTDEGKSLTEKILLQLEKYRQNTPQEKLYLHFDKPYYMAGETMWFKGYLFDGIQHRIDSVSRVVYVDLVNETTGKIIANESGKAMSPCVEPSHFRTRLAMTLPVLSLTKST